MLINIRYFSLSLLAYLVSRFTCQLQLLWPLLWRVTWLSIAWTVAILSIISDQIYLEASKHNDVEKFKVAASLFRLDRNIVTGPAYFYFIQRKATAEALYNINQGLNFDPNAADLLQAKIAFSYSLGKTDDTIRAYARLAMIAPNASIVKLIQNANKK